MTAFDLTTGGSIRQPPEAAASEPATPTAPGSCLPSSPTPATPSRPGPSPSPTETVPAPWGPAPGQPWGRRDRGWESGPPSAAPTCLPRLTSPRPARPLEGGESHETCTAPAPRTARKREESRAFHGYKSKGEVGAGEIRNFLPWAQGPARLQPPAPHGFPSSSLHPWQGGPRIGCLLLGWYPTHPEVPGNPGGPASLGDGPQFPPNGHGEIQQGCLFIWEARA